MLLRLVLLALVATLAGCGATVYTDVLSPKVTLVDSQEGLAVVTIGYVRPADPAAQVARPNLVLYFRAENDPRQTELFLNASAGSMLIGSAYGIPQLVRNTDTDSRILTTYKLKPGRYVMNRYLVEWNDYMRGRTGQSPVRAFPTFEIKAGQITYLGAHLTDVQYGKSAVGLSVAQTFRVRVQDDRAQDLQMLYGLRPELKTVPVTSPL